MTLDDGQFVRYLTDGYLTLTPTSLSAADHAALWERADQLHRQAEGSPGNAARFDILGDNLRARVPELDRLFADPVIDGALTGLFGDRYLIHPHSYCHRSGPADQPFHQDGNLPWNERGHDRTHRPDWGMLFYYPQAVHPGNGPTEVVAGSQYWTVDHERPDGTWHRGDPVDRSLDRDLLAGPDLAARDRALARGLERGLGVPDVDRRFIEGPAGTVLVAHYDLVHRGSRRGADRRPRYLYKFYVARVADPDPRRGPGPAARPAGRPDLAPVVEANLRWLRADPAVEAGPEATGPGVDAGRDGVASGPVALRDDREDRRVEAAYRLGRRAAAGDEGARRALADGLVAGAESTRRAAGLGLRQAGGAGLAILVSATGHDDAPVRRRAVAALGTSAAAEPEVVAALLGVLAGDPDDLARSNAAYSLGQVARSPSVEPGPIVDGLVDRLAPGVEPDNAHSAGFARSTVRQSAAFALVQVLANHAVDPARIDRIIGEGLLADSDRYVQGLVAEGLVRARDLPARAWRQLARHLVARRWSPPPALA